MAREFARLRPVQRARLVPSKFLRCQILAVARIPPTIGEELDKRGLPWRVLRDIGFAWKRNSADGLALADAALREYAPRTTAVTPTLNRCGARGVIAAPGLRSCQSLPQTPFKACA